MLQANYNKIGKEFVDCSLTIIIGCIRVTIKRMYSVNTDETRSLSRSSEIEKCRTTFTKLNYVRVLSISAYVIWITMDS